MRAIALVLLLTSTASAQLMDAADHLNTYNSAREFGDGLRASGYEGPLLLGPIGPIITNPYQGIASPWHTNWVNPPNQRRSYAAPSMSREERAYEAERRSFEREMRSIGSFSTSIRARESQERRRYALPSRSGVQDEIDRDNRAKDRTYARWKREMEARNTPKIHVETVTDPAEVERIRKLLEGL